MWVYFDVEIVDDVYARFRRHCLFRTLQVFQWSCAESGNSWHGPGYGYGRWETVGFA